MHKIWSHTLITEPGMNCIISGPSVHGRGWELKKVTGDQSCCYDSELVRKQQHWVCGGKEIHHNPKSCSFKNLLWGWCLSPIEAFHFQLRFSSESPCLMKQYQHCFSCKKFTQHGNNLYCSCSPKLQCLTSDHHDYTCHCILVYTDTQEQHVFNCLINKKSIIQ